MESIDKALQRRVWQRVQGTCADPALTELRDAPSGEVGPEGLLLDALTDGVMFRHFASKAKEPETTLLRQLTKRTGEQASVLRGICRLSGIALPSVTPAPDTTGRREQHLQGLMGRLLRRAAQYRRLCDHPEFGLLYEGLTQNARDSALLLAQLLGK